MLAFTRFLPAMLSRTSTPSVAGPIYLVAAAVGGGPLLQSRLAAQLQDCAGGAVLTASSILAAVRADVGEEIGVAGARRLAAIDAAELVVADVSDADATVGAEVSYALFRRRCLTLCLCRRGSPGSAFMQGLAGHPLLTTFEYEDATQAEAEAVAFATPPESPGRIFVIEGGDGAGKQTQSRMLLERLRAEGYPCSTLDYPHDTALHGKLIRTLLSGAKGDIKSVNPLLFASLYAQNRADTAPLLNAWLKRGHNVILDRYVEANFGHQASKLPSDERPALIAQLAAFEHDWLDLPRAHRVVYLDLPPEEALKAMALDASRAALDIHETAGDDYKTAVRNTFVWCSDQFEHWRRMPCVDDAGERISKEALHEKLYGELSSSFVNRRETVSK
jgi:dTMP kinase